MHHDIEALRARYKAGELNAWAHSFAQSVLHQHDKGRMLSPKQLAVVAKIATPAPPKPKIALMTAAAATTIAAMFTKAAGKFPALLLLSDVGTLRLHRAGPKSKAPGSITVCGHPGKEYFGRITLAGIYEPSYLDAAKHEVAAALQVFARDPVGAATAYGKLTTHCCFCGKKLGLGEDARSVEVGYGPHCAKKWGLPWGVQ